MMPRRRPVTEYVRISRTSSPAHPYSWRCTVPDEHAYTGECGATSFAASRYLAELSHAAHMTTNHTKES